MLTSKLKFTQLWPAGFPARRIGLALALVLTAAPGALGQQERGFGLNFHPVAPSGYSQQNKKELSLPKLGGLAIWKSDMKKARKALQKGKYQKAEAHFQKAYESGNLAAAWHLGNLHRRGLVGERDMAQALGFYTAIAREYDPDNKRDRLNVLALDALMWIADAYRKGVEEAGIRRQPKQAYNIYMLARGDNSFGRAEFGIGVMYLNGQGVAKRPRRALNLLSQAANRRFPPALALLGDLSWSGKYLKLDRVQGLKWHLIALRHAGKEDYAYFADRYQSLKEKATLGELDSAKRAADIWERSNPVAANRHAAGLPSSE